MTITINTIITANGDRLEGVRVNCSASELAKLIPVAPPQPIGRVVNEPLEKHPETTKTFMEKWEKLDGPSVKIPERTTAPNQAVRTASNSVLSKRESDYMALLNLQEKVIRNIRDRLQAIETQTAKLTDMRSEQLNMAADIRSALRGIAAMMKVPVYRANSRGNLTYETMWYNDMHGYPGMYINCATSKPIIMVDGEIRHIYQDRKTGEYAWMNGVEMQAAATNYKKLEASDDDKK